MISKRLAILFLLFIYPGAVKLSVFAQQTGPPFEEYLRHPWVDSVLNSLSVDQRIAQCIWIAGWSDKGIEHEVATADIIREYGIGGIIFFQGTPEKQAELTNYYQKISKTPLLIAMDAEWGLGMRLDKVVKFPFQMTLGAVKNDSLIYLMGTSVARQCKQMGVHINLAPVADINNNPRNPVINYRSFGESRENVASKAMMYMKGMQDNGILATLKHFPGHGNTETDSHHDLPVMNHTLQQLDSIEFFPFARLIGRGAGSIMTAHLSLPLVDTITNLPSTLSSHIINDLLKTHLGFKGLVITDAMNMKGVTKYFRTGEAEARALAAGNDVVEYVTDAGAVIKEIKKLIEIKKISENDINEKCRKVLAVKYWSGLSKLQPVESGGISARLSDDNIKALIRDLYADALTLLNNKGNLLPLRTDKPLRIATVTINKKEASVFQKRINSYYPAENFQVDPEDLTGASALSEKLGKFDIVIASVYCNDQRPDRNFGIKPGMMEVVEKLTSGNNTIVAFFGNPYALNRFESLVRTDGLILAYQDNEFTEDLVAQLIFGGIGAKGFLPVTINDKWPVNHGIMMSGNIRMQYGYPENAAMSSEILNRKIDSVIKAGLQAKAYPGCEIMAARKGIVVFHKAYGYHTYDERVTVSENDLYDLASVTKVSAAIPGLMLLNSEGRFSPDEKLSTYFPEFGRSDKGNLILRDLLAHQAGLTAWIPFWKKTVKENGNFKRNIFDYQASGKYTMQVAGHMYMNENYRKKIFNEIKKSPLGEKKYVYSDLTFIIVPEIIEKLSGEIWYDYVTKNIYHKIGAFDIVFNPYSRYPLSRIVPTEYDSLFRKQLLHGTVHDEGAAMLGGISGHAGLFATANDLLKLMELYRRMGEYGGERLIAEDVLQNYTSIQFANNKNRRGLGFDKPLPDNNSPSQKNPYPAKSVSAESFGHSGYTGTFVWVDPVYEISYVFLCNRVYPTRNNNRLSEMNIRSGVLQAIYDSIIK
jgi:beta-glucosidase-like glycosyl hydrolase/CubicO group peptidase (beta-lactamase class C family)